MALTEDLHICGTLTATLRHSSGHIADIRRVNNSITLKGRDLVLRLFNGDQTQAGTIARVTEMRLGTSGDAFAATQENLLAPIDEGKIPIVRYESSTVDDKAGNPRKLLRLSADLSEDQYNAELREAALYTEDNIMYNRVVFAPINKSDQFKLTLLWEITF
jgi:hypothetical protein